MVYPSKIVAPTTTGSTLPLSQALLTELNGTWEPRKRSSHISCCVVRVTGRLITGGFQLWQCLELIPSRFVLLVSNMCKSIQISLNPCKSPTKPRILGGASNIFLWGKGSVPWTDAHESYWDLFRDIGWSTSSFLGVAWFHRWHSTPSSKTVPSAIGFPWPRHWWPLRNLQLCVGRTFRKEGEEHDRNQQIRKHMRSDG